MKLNAPTVGVADVVDVVVELLVATEEEEDEEEVITAEDEVDGEVETVDDELVVEITEIDVLVETTVLFDKLVLVLLIWCVAIGALEEEVTVVVIVIGTLDDAEEVPNEFIELAGDVVVDKTDEIADVEVDVDVLVGETTDEPDVNEDENADDVYVAVDVAVDVDVANVVVTVDDVPTLVPVGVVKITTDANELDMLETVVDNPEDDIRLYIINRFPAPHFSVTSPGQVKEQSVNGCTEGGAPVPGLIALPQ